MGGERGANQSPRDSTINSIPGLPCHVTLLPTLIKLSIGLKQVPKKKEKIKRKKEKRKERNRKRKQKVCLERRVKGLE